MNTFVFKDDRVIWDLQDRGKAAEIIFLKFGHIILIEFPWVGPASETSS